MALSEDRLQQWQNRRTARMASLPWLGQETRPGRKPVWFANNELLVVGEHRQRAERLLPKGSTESELIPGLIRFQGSGLDSAAAARSLRQAATADGATGPVAGPNHIFVSAPYEHGGPFGPPQPVAKPRTKPVSITEGSVPVAVIDTGVWRDSPLPAGAYTATAKDYEEDTDVDNDGVIDGDVGHANFIIGVIGRETRHASIRAMRVLDTFGLCTEADLIVALSRLTDEKVVNLSLGGFTLDDQPPVALQYALTTVLAGRDRVVVAAAGNDGVRDRPFWPAAFAASNDQVIAVAAHDGNGICDWSNAGDWVTVAAPGSDITSTFVRHDEFPTGWALWSGTSFATPHVVASLVEQLGKGGTASAAVRTVLENAKARTFDGYPGLT